MDCIEHSGFGRPSTKDRDMTQLKSLYRSLGLFSTRGQAAICEDLAGRPSVLADCFADALSENTKRPSIDQPFLPTNAEAVRNAIGPEDRNDNRIYYRLLAGDCAVVPTPTGDYSYKVIARQVPPLREAGNDRPHSGRGGVDYVGIAGRSPVLGEIKLGGDQNPFYALIQLLVYLSEMATEPQIERAKKHLFGEAQVIDPSPSFDLHILLADFNDRGSKGKLISATNQLVTGFRGELLVRNPSVGARLGNILCMKLETCLATGAEGDQIRLCWFDPKP